MLCQIKKTNIRNPETVIVTSDPKWNGDMENTGNISRPDNLAQTDR